MSRPSIAQHSSVSNEHYTPRLVVAAARRVMGAIDLDPFSCAAANDVVRASRYLSSNGFEADWHGPRVFVNPPGGKLDRKSLKPTKGGPSWSSAGLAWAKLCHEHALGRVEQAVFVGFNLEVIRHSQNADLVGAGSVPMTEFPLCFPKERLAFWNADTDEDDSAPTCANVIAYIGENRAGFREAFSLLGAVT